MPKGEPRGAGSGDPRDKSELEIDEEIFSDTDEETLTRMLANINKEISALNVISERKKDAKEEDYAEWQNYVTRRENSRKVMEAVLERKKTQEKISE